MPLNTIPSSDLSNYAFLKVYFQTFIGKIKDNLLVPSNQATKVQQLAFMGIKRSMKQSSLRN